MNCDIELYAGLSQAQSKLHTLAARLTETEKRLAALESALTAAERLAQTPASSMPDAIEQTEVEPPGCPKCDGVAGTKCRCLDPPAPEPQRCQSLSPRGGVACSLSAPCISGVAVMGEQTTCHLGLAHCHRAEAAEAEVQRLTAEVDALKTACQRIQADLDGSLGLVIDRAEIQPHLDALDDAGRPGWWLS